MRNLLIIGCVLCGSINLFAQSVSNDDSIRVLKATPVSNINGKKVERIVLRGKANDAEILRQMQASYNEGKADSTNLERVKRMQVLLREQDHNRKKPKTDKKLTSENLVPSKQLLKQ